jgi:hypothetical protein
MGLDPKDNLESFLTQIESVEVDSQESWEKSASDLRDVITARKALGREFDHVIRGAYSAHKEARSEKMKFDSDLEKAEKLLRLKLSKFPAQPTEDFDVRKKFVFTITDLDALPREYMCADTKEIQRVLNSLGEATEIEGVEVSCEYRVAVLGVPDED